jgi:hypothetical protein
MSLGADYRAVQVMLRSFGLEPCFTPGNGEGNQVTLGKEEISGVNLATFYVFDKESDGTSPMLQLSAMAATGATAAEVDAIIAEGRRQSPAAQRLLWCHELK